MTDLITKYDPSLTTTDKGDHDKFQHYFRKTAIDKNLSEGTPMMALCGKVVKQQADPNNKTICPTCQDIYDNVVGSNLPPNERD